MTDQEIFDKAVTGVILQGKKSLQDLGKGSTRCAYRGPDGTKCAAGQLLPDDLYTRILEGQTIVGSCGLRGTLGDKLPWTQEQDGLVIGLQRAHDYALDNPHLDFTSQFVGAAIQVAVKNALLYSDIINDALVRRDRERLLQGPVVEKQP